MSRESRMLGGILLVVLPSVMYGGLSLLMFLMRNVAGYNDNPLRHDLWRAGHAHAGVYLLLSLIMLRYVDEAVLSPSWKWLARTGVPIAAILIPAAFFLSMASAAGAAAQWPNQFGIHRRTLSRSRCSESWGRLDSRRAYRAVEVRARSVVNIAWHIPR